MTKPSSAGARQKSFLKGLPFLSPAAGQPTGLTSRQRETLTRIALRIRLPARKMIYRAGSEAGFAFAVAEGVVKGYRELPSGKRVVCAFLFPRDLFGLSENGVYVNCAQSITDVTLHRLPLPELAHVLRHDGDLQFHFLSKITHELRQAQRQSILMGRRDAPGRLAMFLAMMLDRAESDDRHSPVVDLPMTKSDIAGFLGLSLAGVNRAFAELERDELVSFDDAHQARILDVPGFSRLVAAL